MARSGSTFPGVDPHVVEHALSDPRTTLLFVRDVALLLKDCAIDSRIPRRDKWAIAAVAAYLLSPLDVIPDSIPVLGQMDEVWVALWGVRQLLRSAGPQIVRDLWRGGDDGLALVLAAAGLQRRPTPFRDARTASPVDGHRAGGAHL
jgi:uncharacterized membrane protein YkvA (DUF1232 family)